MRNLGVALAILIALLFGGTLYYFMPRTAMVTITGTEVKRIEKKEGQQGTRDVYFIYATNVKTGKARAFRNEDNGWYLKWDSGDIAAQATSLAQAETAEMAQGKARDVVLVKYYGARLPFFSLFPNVLSLEKVPPDYVHIPIFNILFLIVLLFVFIWLGAKLRKLFRAAGERARSFTGRPSPPSA